MHSLLLFTTILGAIPMAASEVFTLDLTPTITQPAALAARQDARCTSSVLSELAPPIPEDQDLLTWFAFNTDEVFTCTVTAPASLSSEFNSWMSQMTEWAEDLESNAHKKSKCGYDIFSLTAPGVCPTSHTVLFTDLSSEETSSQVYPPLPLKTGIRIGAASRNTGMIGTGIALASFVAIVLAL